MEADAEALPFADAAFDVVMSCVGVMFAPHHQQAADELVRVCRPGGTIGLLNWTPAGLHRAAVRHDEARTRRHRRPARSRRRCGATRSTSRALFGDRVERPLRAPDRRDTRPFRGRRRRCATTTRPTTARPSPSTAPSPATPARTADSTATSPACSPATTTARPVPRPAAGSRVPARHRPEELTRPLNEDSTQRRTPCPGRSSTAAHAERHRLHPDHRRRAARGRSTPPPCTPSRCTATPTVRSCGPC